MKYLVFGATGNIGGRVARKLIEDGHRPSVFVRDEKKARMLFGDQIDIHAGDLDSPGRSLETALAEAARIFLVTDGPDLAEQDRVVSTTAIHAGVEHIVKLSTLDAVAGVGTGAWHAAGEAAVAATGVPFTFIRAAGFMSNALSWSYDIRHAGMVRSSTGDGRIAFIHPDDIAAVVMTALTMPEEVDRTVVITGPEALSYGEMASVIGSTIGKRVGFEAISDQQAYADAAAWAGDSRYVDALIDIWRAVREGRINTVTTEVRQIIGREPVRFAQWAAENSASFR
ncbi:NmrA family NAD(P)-binding protein [Microbacterium azadirachtae]|uniref:NmrA family NAD(P)-binding protein n=1 Tax=Microbacterium azadirachtae TaxID=582680 RepID=UPI003F751EA5